MRNIFLLPTDKPSSGYILGKCIKELSDVKIGQLVRTHYMMFSNEYFQPQNIYITNDEEIKEGDWYLDLSVFTNNISIGKGIYQMKYSKWGEEGQGDCKKIILTDNEDLIKDGVQAIDEDFLQWFVKNSSCESVKGERLDTFKKTNEVYVDEIAGGNYYEIIKQYKIIIPQEETKQETLEKVAKKQWGNVHRTESIDFIVGANLQAERILTDGDLVKLLDFVSKEYNISNGVGWFHSHESIEDVSSKEVLDKWFEQFKKK
jgi:hypothetical protein